MRRDEPWQWGAEQHKGSPLSRGSCVWTQSKGSQEKEKKKLAGYLTPTIAIEVILDWWTSMREMVWES